jgi:hypothetical protein
MAHFIKLHTAGQNQEILFNLDTVVSIEPYGNENQNSTILTRWSHQNVKESLDEIQRLAKGQGEVAAKFNDIA